MKLIVGLGNPGTEYAMTRHNLGFQVVEQLCRDFAFNPFSASSQAKTLITQGQYRNQKIILALPQTFMNLSGAAIGRLMAYYKIDSQDLWVIQDELDLAWGTMRKSVSRSSGGHNGIQSIIDTISTTNFCRFRIGIGNASLRSTINPKNFVLQTFTLTETSQLAKVITAAAGIIADHLETPHESQDFRLI